MLAPDRLRKNLNLFIVELWHYNVHFKQRKRVIAVRLYFDFAKAYWVAWNHLLMCSSNHTHSVHAIFLS